MTITLSLPWIYTIVAGVLGVTLCATDEWHGSFISMPTGRTILGVLLLLSIPVLWVGVWMGGDR